MNDLTKLCVKQTLKSLAIWYGVAAGVVLLIWLARILAWSI